MSSPPGRLRDNSLSTEGWCAIFDALRNNPQNKIAKWDLSPLERSGNLIGQGITPTITNITPTITD